jgi:hypothetical protein
MAVTLHPDARIFLTGSALRLNRFANLRDSERGLLLNPDMRHPEL